MTRPRRHAAARQALEEAATHHDPMLWRADEEPRSLDVVVDPPAVDPSSSGSTPSDQTDSVIGWLSQQAVVSQAAGMLMAYYGIPEQTALVALRRWSQRASVNVAEMATALVRLGSQPSLHPFGALRAALRSFALDLDAEDELGGPA